MASNYCEYARKLPENNYHRRHHDEEHGILAKDDDDLFRRLILEINQAGLSFDMVLKRKTGIYAVYSSISEVANFGQKDVKRLLRDDRIIKNRLKIEAAIYNAKRILEIQKEFGSFKGWLDKRKGMKLDDWVMEFKMNFKFTGGEIVNEFLMSTCYLPGAHENGCTIYRANLHEQKRR